MRAMRTSNAVLLVVALCTAVPSIKGQVPVNADPGLQKFFLVPESVLSQIPHQDKIIPIPQNIVSTAPGAVGGQPTFQSVQNSHQNPSRVALTPEQAEYARQQEAFRQSAIDANRRLVSQRKEQAALTNNQFSQNSAGQQFAQSDQFFDNQQHSQQAHQVHSQVQPVHAQTPARRVKPHRQKASQVVVPGQNQVSHQHRVHHQQVQQPLAQQQQQQYQQQVQQQQLRQPQVQQQQLRQPQVQQQFQQPQVQQQQFQQPQQQQFAPSAQPQVQPQPAAQRQVQQPAAPASSFISTQPSTESQRFKSQALRDEDEIIRHQAENAKYSFSSSVNDGINDQQHIRQETRDGLKLAGLYSYSDGFYKRTIHYEADENGYRVINEETEPIGNGPNTDPSGIAEVSSDVGGTSVRYSISGQDFPPQPITANEQFASNTFQNI